MFLIPIGLAFFVIRVLERRGRTASKDPVQEESESQKTTP